MIWLLQLVTPAGGTVLDPFAGSGSTGKAAMRLGFSFIGMEQDEEYCNVAEARIKHEHSKRMAPAKQAVTVQPVLLTAIPSLKTASFPFLEGIDK